MTPDRRVNRLGRKTDPRPKWEVMLRCRECDHQYKRTMRAESQIELEHLPNPPCPKCNAIRPKRPELNWAAGEVPNIGGSPQAKAADKAAEMIMEDHGLSNIRGPTETRHGEPSTIRLDPKLQAVADSVFGGNQTPSALLGGGRTVTGGPRRSPLKIGGMNPNSPAFRRAVLSGGFSGGNEASAAIATQHQKKERPQDIARIIYDDKKA